MKKIITKVVIEIKSGKVLEEESFLYEGMIAECKGGGQSGTVGWPDWMENSTAHLLFGYGSDLTGGEYPGISGSDSLNLSLFDVMNTALGVGGNPFENKTSFDPNAALTPAANSPIKRMSDAQTNRESNVNAVNPETDWKAAVDAITTKFSSLSSIDFLDNLSTSLTGMITAVQNLVDGSKITDATTAFENSQLPKFMRGVGRFAAGMADSNSTMSSAFIIGLAMLEEEFGRQVSDFEANLTNQLYNSLVTTSLQDYLRAQVLRVQNKDTMVIQGSQVILDLEKTKESLLNQLTSIKVDLERLIIVAEKEKVDAQLDIDYQGAKFDLDVFNYGGNMLASPSGSAVYAPPQVSRAQSALSGALSGASIGASIGASAGGIAAGPAALIGGIIGLGAGLL